MWGLVVGVHLPHHCLTVLVVEPEGIDGIGCRHTTGVDADIVVALTHTHDDFFAPVTHDVAREARVVLGPVVHLASRRSEKTTAAWLEDGGLALSARTVKYFGKEVAVVIYTEVEVAPSDVVTDFADDFVGHATDHASLRGASHSTWIGIGEVGTEGASVVAAAGLAVIDLAGSGVAIVGRWLILVACENLESFTEGVEVGAMEGIAMT